jgi:ActR/RegA family two-component response regulator
MNTILNYCAGQEHDRELIKAALANHINLITTESRAQCLEAIKQKAPIHKAFVHVANENGEIDLKIFKELSTINPELRMIAVGDHDTETAAIKAVRLGAAGYIILPVNADEILTTAR